MRARPSEMPADCGGGDEFCCGLDSGIGFCRESGFFCDNVSDTCLPEPSALPLAFWLPVRAFPCGSLLSTAAMSRLPSGF